MTSLDRTVHKPQSQEGKAYGHACPVGWVFNHEGDYIRDPDWTICQDDARLNGGSKS